MSKYKLVVPHPGVYIKDALEELGMSQTEFAYRTGLSIKNVSTLINGESNITFEVAKKLASYFGSSIDVWMNLQNYYDKYLCEEREEQEYKEDWEIAKAFDRKFICNYCHVNFDIKKKEKTIDELRTCFNVTLLKALKQPDLYVFFKASTQKEIDEKTIIMRNAWLTIADKNARKMSCKKEFDKGALISVIPSIRELTLEKPKNFLPKLESLLSNAGVKLVILPYLSHSNVSGATKWLSNEKCVLVAINDCGKEADRFWFSLFHELGHAIKNHKRHMTISYEKNKIIDQEEIEANEFAMDSLIDKNSYSNFVNEGKYDLESIHRFASKEGVADFIVIGRLQNDGIVSWDKYREQKIRYQIVY